MSTSTSRSHLRFTDLLPGLLRNARRLPQISLSGISTYLLFDQLPYSVGVILERNARQFAHRPALLCDDLRLTYDELNRLVNRWARLFREHGVCRGDAVAVYMENRPETLMITAALAKIGATASLINPNQRGDLLLHSLKLKPCRAYAVGEERVEDFESVRSALPDHGALRFQVGDGKSAYVTIGYIDLQTASAGLSEENLPETRDIRTHEHLAYIFTSGTTGLPKAAIQSHKQWLRSMQWFGKINLNLMPEDVLYVSIPFYHANALMISWASAFGAGAALAIRRKFSVSAFWDDIRKYNATAFVYIGEICRYLMNAPASDRDRDHVVTRIVGNGMRPDIWNGFKSRFGIGEIYEFYGASESNIVFTNTFNLDKTVGWTPASYAIVKYDVENDEPLRDRKGRLQKVSTGETGLMISEITTMFPFQGYVNAKNNASKIFTDVFKKGDRWFNTGDLMRDIGFKHAQFVDRVGDTFRWKGENVATADVERVLDETGWISASAAYGVQIPGCDGRAGMACVSVQRWPSKEELTILADLLCSRLPAYAVPLFLRITASFELTDTQKIKKGPLKQQGFDPSVVRDPLYFLAPGNASFVEVDTAMYDAVCTGKQKV